MKIVFLISSLGAGGAERVASTLCNLWALRGNKVTLALTFLGEGKPFYEVSKSVELIRLGDITSQHQSVFSYFLRFYGLVKMIRMKKPDVIISFLPNANVAGILAGICLSIPSIACERSDPSSRKRLSIREFLYRKIYRYADVLVVQTHSVAHSIFQQYPKLKLVHTIANPLPDEVAEYGKMLTKKNRHVLLSLGRLVPEKQVDKTIYVFSRLVDDYPDWDLYIYGDGPCRPVLENLIKSLNLSNRIFLKGKTSHPWKVMAEADIFVMTSKQEGFPNSLLEAMGVGVPCIVFDCLSGPRDITRNGQDALLVSLDNIIELEVNLRKLMDDEIFRENLGRKGCESVWTRYNLNTIAQNWDLLFQEIKMLKTGSPNKL